MAVPYYTSIVRPKRRRGAGERERTLKPYKGWDLRRNEAITRTTGRGGRGGEGGGGGRAPLKMYKGCVLRRDEAINHRSARKGTGNSMRHLGFSV